VFVYLAMMGEAFFGYLLPWGQMSFWGAGHREPVRHDSAHRARSGGLDSRRLVVSDATLNRFFAFHVARCPGAARPVAAHLIALHEVGSNKPDGSKSRRISCERQAARWHTVSSLLHGQGRVRRVVFLIVFSAVLFFAPEMGGYFLEQNNFIPADPLKTPEHIAPSGTSRPTTRSFAPCPNAQFAVSRVLAMELPC